MTILEAMADRNLFWHWFSGESWTAWKVLLAGLFGLPMTPEQLEIYKQHTNRNTPPVQTAREGWLVVGRRGGKSLISALVAVYLACFREYTNALAPGERAIVMVIAADRKQARVVFRYISGQIEGVPMLAAMVDHHTKESITLTNQVTVEVHTANFRAAPLASSPQGSGLLPRRWPSRHAPVAATGIQRSPACVPGMREAVPCWPLACRLDMTAQSL